MGDWSENITLYLLLFRHSHMCAEQYHQYKNILNNTTFIVYKIFVETR